ncbi:hypothetical protein Ccrd_022800 [Cynara cardunculus var. scolymus]|uniref:Sieve element occlusion n=1 Tax=Cynara cardunculus var. scolymus TaxID=59895 RepID=A0A118JZ71_CYNCS|nr:hypothetical protein Ccrd_022800 [Cynara cardunculus var. scolymus]
MQQQQQQQQKLVKKERRMFSSSDDSSMMKQVVATHSPDGREVDLEPILNVVEETLRLAIPANIDGVINFSCKCSGGADAHASTIAILNLLSSYTWEAKVVISLGAFAVNFGEFWLVAQLFATNPLAKSVALLKQLPNIIEHYKSLKPRFDAINNLINAMLVVTKCIIAFKNLPYQYLQDDTPPKSTALAHVPTAAYWYITATSEAWELSSLAHKVNVDILRKKTVLLLISDLEISHEEILVLTQIYKESRTYPQIQYEVVWVPVVDLMTWNDAHQHKLEQLQSMMTWHMLHHPTLLEPAVVKYIKQVWHFEKKPILVVLDPQGRVTSPNALHMVWIWQNVAYPFTSIKEEALWKEETWKLELLVDSIDRHILRWIAEEKYICLYGGDDLDWIRRFTKLARDITTTAGIQLEMVYVGKSGTKERIRKISATVSEEKLSHTWPDPTSVWYFWTRLESMLYSKIQHGKSFENDPIMKEVMTMMSFDGSDQGWALICRGSSEMTRAKADLALTSLTQYENWEGDAQEIGFVPALKAYLAKLHTPQHCNRLILPGISGGIPEVVVCSECGRTMEKFFMFRCCTD